MKKWPGNQQYTTVGNVHTMVIVGATQMLLTVARRYVASIRSMVHFISGAIS